MKKNSAIGLAKDVGVVAAVTLFCYASTAYTGFGLLLGFFPAGISAESARTFEQHLWQFILGFTAIGYLSRGHLWSYGINSNNLKVSMQWLGALYAVSIAITIVAWSGNGTVRQGEWTLALNSAEESVMVLLIQWMSSPVANQILFFGFAQTVMMKRLRTGNGPVRSAVIMSVAALLFTVMGTGLPAGSDTFAVVSTFILGIFSSMVYWKTGSLITPMLGQAFYFGFPLFIAIVHRQIFP
jgi:hypothetical protein